jgi:hypothetical protein
MLRMSSHDGAVLARVAKYSRFTQERRRSWLHDVSPEAETVGTILISGDTAGASQDCILAAESIRQWAAEERRA